MLKEHILVPILWGIWRTCLYLINEKAFAINLWYWEEQFVFLILILYLLYRKKQSNKFISYNELFVYILIFFCGIAIMNRGIKLLFFSVDSQLMNYAFELEYSSQVAELEYINAKETIDDSKITEMIKKDLSLLNQFIQLLLSCTLSSFISAFLALLFAHKKYD